MPFTKHLHIAIILLLSLFGVACHKVESFENDYYGNFDALWTMVDEHYCFFEQKDVDWNEIRSRYRDRINPDMTVNEFFDLLSDMLAELKDGHVNLSSRFNTFYYREWWSNYPQDFSMRTLEQYYLDFDYRTTNGIIYKVLNGDIGYIYYPSFSYHVSDTSLDYILAWFKNCKGLIIDVRDNGGGNLTNIDKFVARFIREKTLGGYIRHKTGKGHGDFSEPYPFYYEPASDSFVHWDKQIAVLCNRSTFSAANDFVSVMKSLPQVTVIGACTGGGGGMPFTYEIPIGWSLRLSASPISNALDESIEDGIEPTEGFALHAWSDQLANGVDAILDRAIMFLREAD
ncbi:MAG: S41 family peptidase [Muribaculaceae bacterium]|nr:S41 family peptidase [Muribaculaceae bacterium]